MNFEEINPFVRQAVIAKLDRRNHYTYTKLKSPDCRLFYIVSGNGSISFENAEYKIQPGTVILFPAGTKYIWFVDNMKYYAINFDYTQKFNQFDKTLHAISSSTIKNTNVLKHPDFDDIPIFNNPVVIYDVLSLEKYFNLIVTEFNIKSELYKPLTSSLLKTLLIRIFYCKTHLKNKKDNSSKVVRDIIEYITSNYDKDITNTKISEVYSFNASYINRVFKQYTGKGIRQFLINYRINAAAEMLTNSNMSIEEICLSTGFKDVSHFSKTFKKHVGKNPCVYRNTEL